MFELYWVLRPPVVIWWFKSYFLHGKVFLLPWFSSAHSLHIKVKWTGNVSMLMIPCSIYKTSMLTLLHAYLKHTRTPGITSKPNIEGSAPPVGRVSVSQTGFVTKITHETLLKVDFRPHHLTKSTDLLPKCCWNTVTLFICANSLQLMFGSFRAGTSVCLCAGTLLISRNPGNLSKFWPKWL